MTSIYEEVEIEDMVIILEACLHRVLFTARLFAIHFIIFSLYINLLRTLSKRRAPSTTLVHVGIASLLLWTTC